MNIREVTDGRESICNEILRTLPDWFGIESAIVDYVRSVGTMPMFVALHGEHAIGFVSLAVHNAFSVEIHVMGVLPGFHGRGVGRALMSAVESYSISRGVRFLNVKTLAPSREDASYARTRRFYSSVGFVPLQELDIWGPENPCLLMIKAL